MKIKKILKIIGIIVGILIILLLVHTIRNYIIITDLQDKFSQYSDSSNYYIKSIATEDNGTIITMKYYSKDNKQVVFLERNINGETSKISMYDDGEKTDTFWDNKENKIVQLDSETMIEINIYNRLETDNNWQTFLGSIFASVKSTNYNGKECYVIRKNSRDSKSLNYNECWIDKETMMNVRNVMNTQNENTQQYSDSKLLYVEDKEISDTDVELPELEGFTVNNK